MIPYCLGLCSGAPYNTVWTVRGRRLERQQRPVDEPSTAANGKEQNGDRSKSTAVKAEPADKDSTTAAAGVTNGACPATEAAVAAAKNFDEKTAHAKVRCWAFYLSKH